MVLFWRLCRQILVLATELREIVILHCEGDHVSTVHHFQVVIQLFREERMCVSLKGVLLGRKKCRMSYDLLTSSVGPETTFLSKKVQTQYLSPAL